MILYVDQQGYGFFIKSLNPVDSDCSRVFSKKEIPPSTMDMDQDLLITFL